MKPARRIPIANDWNWSDQRNNWVMNSLVAGTLLVSLSLLSGSVMGAEKTRIDLAISRAQRYLMDIPQRGAHGSLAAYSLYKSGVDKNHKIIQDLVKEVVAKFSGGAYSPGIQHTYEAGVDAMLLEAIDRETYQPQLQMIADYLVRNQRPHGGWYYPQIPPGGEFGDTSITQYGILGLWAAHRGGAEIPTDTWEKAAKWLILTQRREGAWGYHPTAPVNGFTGGDILPTMGIAGTGSLLVIRHVLFRDAVFDDEIRPAQTAPSRRFGVLERLADEKEKEKDKTKPRLRTSPTMLVSTFDKAIKEGMRWNSDNFGSSLAQHPNFRQYPNYYYYGVERIGALLDVDKIGTHDWYEDGVESLLPLQLKDGSWSDGCGPIGGTSLTLLFLSKATAASVGKPKKKAPLVGGGLLVGGRGLPDNLGAVKVQDGAVSTRKLNGPVDQLLAELEKSSGAKVEEAQEAIVEAVQLDRPQDLIGQLELLKRLAGDKRAEVRRTAMWALGRTGDVSVSPLLIKGLSDVDESVMRESSAALCILSRRPNGIGIPTDPSEGLDEGASNEARAAHMDKWQKNCTRLWTDWYLKIRPYDERDDRTSLKRKP